MSLTCTLRITIMLAISQSVTVITMLQKEKPRHGWIYTGKVPYCIVYDYIVHFMSGG